MVRDQKVSQKVASNWSIPITTEAKPLTSTHRRANPPTDTQGHTGGQSSNRQPGHTGGQSSNRHTRRRQRHTRDKPDSKKQIQDTEEK